MQLEFECKTCHQVFECDMGTVSFSTDPPTFGNDPVCPRCGVRAFDDVLLTEIGQGQLTEAFMKV